MDKHLPRCPCVFLTSAQAHEAEISCCCGYILQTLADLRAKVEALRNIDPHYQPVRDAYDKVLALFDGSGE